MVSIFQENFAHLASQQFHLALYPSFVTDCLLFFLFVVGLFCCLFVYKMLVQGGSNTRLLPTSFDSAVAPSFHIPVFSSNPIRCVSLQLHTKEVLHTSLLSKSSSGTHIILSFQHHITKAFVFRKALEHVCFYHKGFVYGDGGGRD